MIHLELGKGAGAPMKEGKHKLLGLVGQKVLKRFHCAASLQEHPLQKIQNTYVICI